mmetsp:Transcript_21456/g.36849  ORF Transcript_21456/g.36849 Transcript_21456/m.36849 type:complete len:169 (+) Transcript_21456:105-611(+)|eukprot:CAMPEP_0183771728 /NCGR_PEP_ID=MMETSP0739-20130205/33554_1 /TAXON_ID=385413 /ORGANISM="Thalassiosira miniscula, Strain CCMP1093" /LENGTH=168 /DNA_ID=CAMNT_0026012209 /DNA_START=35 /DNA_END=541 /DNA_ORIENTATION=+
MELIVEFPQRHDPQHMQSPRVTFSDQSETYTVENLSFEYKDELWFSSQDMDNFKLQTANVMWGITHVLRKSMAQYAQENSNNTSAFLGLEGYLSKDATHQIKLRRKMIRKVVLLEQQRQAAAGVDDPEAIAYIAKQISESGRIRARVIGLLHAENRDSQPLEESVMHQ